MDEIYIFVGEWMYNLCGGGLVINYPHNFFDNGSSQESTIRWAIMGKPTHQLYVTLNFVVSKIVAFSTFMMFLNEELLSFSLEFVSLCNKINPGF